MPRTLLLLALTLLLGQADCTNTKKLDKSVCATWAFTDKALLDQAVDTFARSLDPKQPMDGNARAIANWLEKQPCIRQVSLPAIVVETLPPALDIGAFHRDGTKRTFSVQFGPDKIKLSYSY